MKAILNFCLIFTITASQVLASCQIYYLEKTKNFQWLTFKSDEFPTSILKDFESLDLKTQINELNKLNRALSEKLFHAQDQIKNKTIFVNLGVEDEKAIYENLRKDLMNEVAYYTDLIVDKVKIQLDKANIANQIVVDKLSNGVKYSTLVILPDPSSSSKVSRHLYRLMKRFEVKSFEFDPMSTLAQNFAGIYYPSDRSIRMGTKYIGAMIADDSLNSMILHEFQHAVFENMRLQKRDSIYHVQYRANGDIPLSQADHGYTRYMSAEETYNYLIEPYWLSKRTELNHFWEREQLETYFDDLFSLFRYSDLLLHQSYSLAIQARRFTSQLRKASISEKLKNIRLIDEQRLPVRKARDAQYIIFENPETLHEIQIYIPNHMKKNLKWLEIIDKKIFDLSQKHFGRDFYRLSKSAQMTIEQKLNIKDIERFENIYQEILNLLDDVHARQLAVIDIADQTIPNIAQQAKSVEIEIIEYFNFRKNTILDDENLRLKLLNLRKSFAQLGRELRKK